MIDVPRAVVLAGTRAYLAHTSIDESHREEMAASLADRWDGGVRAAIVAAIEAWESAEYDRGREDGWAARDLADRDNG